MPGRGNRTEVIASTAVRRRWDPLTSGSGGPCTSSAAQGVYFSGERGIRTLGTLASSHDFQSCTFGHSVISPVRREAGHRAYHDSNSKRILACVDPWFVYVARCADGTLYVGIARDVAARISQHDAGLGARYTRGRGPLTVLATRRCAGQGDALRLEMALKRLPREAKLSLTASRRKLASFARTAVKRRS